MYYRACKSASPSGPWEPIETHAVPHRMDETIAALESAEQEVAELRARGFDIDLRFDKHRGNVVCVLDKIGPAYVRVNDKHWYVDKWSKVHKGSLAEAIRDEVRDKAAETLRTFEFHTAQLAHAQNALVRAERALKDLDNTVDSE